jgi:hypothetical protein
MGKKPETRKPIATEKLLTIYVNMKSVVVVVLLLV